VADGKRIPIFDIHEAAYLDVNGIEVFETLQRGRVVWEVAPQDKVYQLLRDYHENPTVRLLDFVKALKKTRSRMLDLRDGQYQRTREIIHESGQQPQR
jgi:hypothetical protein